MTIELHVEPQTIPLSWEDFYQKYPDYSLAIDGYVIGESRFQLRHGKPIANFNHHEHVNRYATRSTSGQLLLAIRSNLYDGFRDELGDIAMNIYTNDCDEDVCLSVYLLRNGFLHESPMNPKLNRLVAFEDTLDTTSGTYAYPRDLPFLKEVAWIFEPYHEARRTGLLSRKKDNEYLRIISDVERRIQAHIVGNGDSLPLETTFQVVGGGQEWSMVEETGAQARIGMMSSGIKAFVSVQPREDGNYTYTLGKSSPFVTVFDLGSLYERFNEIDDVGEDRWGGSDTIGGSPRVHGSTLPPEEVEKIINEWIGR